MSLFKKTKQWLTLIVFVLVLGTSFSIINYVFAADDNVNDAMCEGGGPPNYIVNCDESEAICESASGVNSPYIFVNDGYPSSAGSASCCGDDSQEVYGVRVVGPCSSNNCPSFSSSSSDDACCSSSQTCIYNGNCYNSGDKITVSGEAALCIDPVLSTDPTGWYDCDNSDGHLDYCDLCGYKELPSGEVDVGEYDNWGDWECCGDDDNEYFRECSKDAEISWSCSGAGEACCDYYQDCIHPITNECIDRGFGESVPVNNLNAGGNDNIAVCNGSWSDCDQEWPGVGYYCASGCSYYGTQTVESGEEGVGEYEFSGQTACCGDDANEYYTTSFCTGYTGDGICCAEAGQKIAADGSCVDECTQCPYVPSSPSPSNDGSCVSAGDQTLSVTGGDPDGTGNVTYVFYVREDGVFYGSFSITESADESLIAVSVPLSLGKRYDWQVDAIDETQCSETSDGWTFFTKECTGGECCVEGCALAEESTTCTDDGNPCTSDICDFNGNCVHPEKADGTTCGTTACNSDECCDPALDTYCDYPNSSCNNICQSGECQACDTEAGLCEPDDFCVAGSCGAECGEGENCSAYQCADGGQFYQPRESLVCKDDCQCPAFDEYGTCVQSENLCSAECGTDADCVAKHAVGWICDTTIDVCSCIAPSCPMVNIDDIDPSDNPTTETSIDFIFSTQNNPVTIECDLDNSGSWVDCSSLTKSYSGLSVGDHVFKVRVAKPGCSGYSYDSYSWEIQAEPECYVDGDCNSTVCPADGCYGTYKMYDYPYSVTNTCENGTCTNNSCSASQTCDIDDCGAECITDNCSTSRCKSANDQEYLQTRSNVCQSNCTCSDWPSSNENCRLSFNNCSVECYEGTGCNTAYDACYCETGYAPNGSGRCDLISGVDFVIGRSPWGQTVNEGQNANYGITLTSVNGFNATVALAASNCPSGAVCSFSPSSLVPTGSSTFTVSGAPAGGPYNITINAVGGGKLHSAGVQLTVQAVGGENNAPNEPTNLKQFGDDGELSEGDSTTDNTPYFSFEISDPDANDTVGYQIQVDDNCSFSSPGVDFTWVGSTTNPNSVIYQVPSGSEFIDDDYCWRARTRDGSGSYSDWVQFGSDGVTDFTVDTGGQSLVANFSWCNLTSDTILFIDDTNSNPDSWEWDFGDGGICDDSSGCNETGYGGTNQTPVHEFNTGTGGVPGGWWTSGLDWGFRIKVNFKNASRGALTNVPVLIKLNDTFDFNRTQNDGRDIRFIDEDNVTQLNYEIEKWDKSAEEASVWVKVPRIDASDLDYIYLYYGNSTAGDNQNPGGVWDSNYVAVYHHAELNDTDDLSDSTNNNYDADLPLDKYCPAYTGITLAGGARDYESDDYFDLDNQADHAPTGNGTIEAWIDYDWSPTYDQRKMITEIRDGAGSYAGIQWEDGPDYRFELMYNPPGDFHEVTISPTECQPNTWCYLAMTWDDGNNMYGYLDGVEKGSDTNIASWSGTPIYWRIGQNYNAWRQRFDGQIDEMRFSKIQRSEDWIEFQHCSMQQSCVDYEPEISQGGTEFDVTLTVTEGATSDDYVEHIDTDLGESCGYNLTNVNAVNCQTVELDWQTPSYWTPPSYFVYHSDVSASGPWTLVDQVATSAYSHYDSDLADGAEHWYFVSSYPPQLNNSTAAPVCVGGFTESGNVCPLSDVTPICPVDIEDLTVERHCGYLNIKWEDAEVNDYQLLKCIGSDSNKCMSSEYFENNHTVVSESYSCDAGLCSLRDDEVMPVNVANPPSSSFYCYKIITQAEEDGDWGEISTDNPVCGYSYCYRAPSWQER